jgi:hypothetical protein
MKYATTRDRSPHNLLFVGRRSFTIP